MTVRGVRKRFEGFRGEGPGRAAGERRVRACVALGGGLPEHARGAVEALGQPAALEVHHAEEVRGLRVAPASAAVEQY